MDLKQKLRGFRGGGDWTPYALNDMIWFSPGVQCLAKDAHAWWLVTDIAAHFTANPKLKRALAEDPGLDSLNIWVLTKNGDGAILTCRLDDGEPAVVTAEYKSTDFPFDVLGSPFTIYAGKDGEGPRKIYLPSEW